MARDSASMLEVLLGDERLSEEERTAFGDMRRKLKNGWISKLSAPQDDWVKRVYLRLELDADEPSANLVSSGVVPRTSSKEPYAFETMPRPLRPPPKRT